jgi:hypothetical protein
VIGDNFGYFYGGNDLRVIDNGIDNFTLGVYVYGFYIEK